MDALPLTLLVVAPPALAALALLLYSRSEHGYFAFRELRRRLRRMW